MNRPLVSTSTSPRELNGIVEMEMLRRIPGAAGWPTYETRFPRGYTDALLIGFDAELRLQKERIREALGGQFKVSETADGTWLVNDLLVVGFRISFPRIHGSAMAWEFRLLEDEPPLVLGFGMTLPIENSSKVFRFITHRLKDRPQRLRPLLQTSGTTGARQNEITSDEDLVEIVKRAMFVGNPIAEEKLLALARRQPMLNVAALAREMGCTARQAGRIVKDLEAKGHKFCPRFMKRSRVITVVCSE
ncbi:MAG: hypothetical protein KY432_03740 [Acidobacteria bacterium]|nr:hypothetical protein [Acidobacteriota bacterium]